MMPIWAQTNTVIDSLQDKLSKVNDTNLVLVSLEIANQYKRIDTDKALEFAIKGKQEAENMNYLRGEALSYKILASIYQSKGDMPKAEKLAIIALEKLQLYGTLVEQADVTNLLGLIYMGEAKYYQAEKYYKDALYMYIDIDDSVGVVIALHNIGVVNFYRGEYDEVARYYRSSLKLAERLENERFINVNLLNLGLLFSAQKDYQKAKQYIRKALINFRSSGEKAGEANAMVHLASAYFNDGQMDSSLAMNKEALRLYTEVGSENGISQALSHIADIMVEYQKYSEAKTYFEQAITLRRKNQDQYGMAISFTGLANAWYGMGNIGIAKLYYDSALTLSKQIGTIWQTAEVYQSIAHFHSKQGNYKEAYQALEEFTLLKDSLFNREKMEVAKELAAQYEMDKANEEIEQQKSKNKILKRSNTLFTFLLMAIVVIFILVIWQAISRYKRTRIKHQQEIELADKNRQLAETKQQIMASELEKSKLEQEKIKDELDFKKRELTQIALHINQQNEFLESLKQNLMELKDNPEVKSLERNLDAQLNIDKQREDFELNIDLINQDFYRTLSLKFPQLTENEKKLCAMLRLNLSSKEIASIQNISPKSVDMNRYRMRKKLNLDPEADLVKYLNQI